MIRTTNVRFKIHGLRFAKQLQLAQRTINTTARCKLITQHAFLNPVLLTALTFMLSPKRILLLSALNVTLRRVSTHLQPLHRRVRAPRVTNVPNRLNVRCERLNKRHVMLVSWIGITNTLRKPRDFTRKLQNVIDPENGLHQKGTPSSAFKSTSMPDPLLVPAGAQ